MPTYAVVIKDPKVAREKEVERNVTANLRHHFSGQRLIDADQVAVTSAAAKIRAHFERNVGPEKAIGDLHASAATECPDGLPNCRNCGDPDHADTCREAGHCPLCGTLHGVAPDSVVAANGYELVEIPTGALREGVWDRKKRKFESFPPE